MSAGVLGTPEWSPDGRYLAFPRERDDGVEVFVAAVAENSGAAKQYNLGAIPGRNIGIAWAVMGNTIYYSSRDSRGLSGSFDLPFVAAPTRGSPGGARAVEETIDGVFFTYGGVRRKIAPPGKVVTQSIDGRFTIKLGTSPDWENFVSANPDGTRLRLLMDRPSLAGGIGVQSMGACTPDGAYITEMALPNEHTSHSYLIFRNSLDPNDALRVETSALGFTIAAVRWRPSSSCLTVIDSVGSVRVLPLASAGN